MQILTRKVRRMISRGFLDLRPDIFGSMFKTNMFYGRTRINPHETAESVPAIGWRVNGSDGVEYQIMLTDADIRAINHARHVTYAGDEYGWPEAARPIGPKLIDPDAAKVST